MKSISRVKENLEIILSEGERLTALINDVLDISKLEAGKVEWKMEKFRLSDIIERAIGASSALFEQKRLRLIKDIEDGLPEVIGDRGQINSGSNKSFVKCRKIYGKRFCDMQGQENR